MLYKSDTHMLVLVVKLFSRFGFKSRDLKYGILKL
jgi:hypothetical protein